ncbi:MAG TPA: LemA family protein, partial [Candidatus Saccharimonadales bacterium]
MPETQRPDFRYGDRVIMNEPSGYPDDEVMWVKVEPYPVKGVWKMLVAEDGHDYLGEAEVECSDYHLIGYRKPPKPKKPLISPSTKKILKKLMKGTKMKLTKPAIVTAVALGFVFIMGMTVAGNYNSLVKVDADVDNAWAKVETQYQRRFDLIGNLVESVKGSQFQELAVFKAIAEGRKQYTGATTPEGKAEAATSIETNLALVPRLQEAYPELKSNANVQAL